jgi:pilus assembly protein Flp/PilA
MLKYYIKTRDALERLWTDKGGVVSFEYVIVAGVVVAAVSLAFGNSSTGIGSSLTTALGHITSTVNSCATGTAGTATTGC